MDNKKVSKSQQDAVNRYKKRHYKRYTLEMRKDEAASIEQAAASAGMSVAAFFRAAVRAKMGDDATTNNQP